MGNGTFDIGYISHIPLQVGAIYEREPIIAASTRMKDGVVVEILTMLQVWPGVFEIVCGLLPFWSLWANVNVFGYHLFYLMLWSAVFESVFVLRQSWLPFSVLSESTVLVPRATPIALRYSILLLFKSSLGPWWCGKTMYRVVHGTPHLVSLVQCLRCASSVTATRCLLVPITVLWYRRLVTVCKGARCISIRWSFFGRHVLFLTKVFGLIRHFLLKVNNMKFEWDYGTGPCHVTCIYKKRKYLALSR